MAIKTTSLETSKLLKEAGFRQDTYFYWVAVVNCNDIEKMEFYNLKNHHYIEGYGCARPDLKCSALTTDELLEELPYRITGHNQIAELVIHKNSCDFVVGYKGEPSSSNKWFDSHHLPEALAQMWLWLKKENLI